MKITKEEFEGLPEGLKSNFIEDGDTFISSEAKKLAENEGKLNEMGESLAQLQANIAQQEQSKQDEIQAAADAAYEKAKTEGDTSKEIEILTQRANDAASRADKYESEVKEIKQGLATEKEQMIIKGFLIHAKEGCEMALERLLSGYVKVDPETSAEQFLNDDTTVSSLDRKSFISEQLFKNPVFTSLTKGEQNVSNNGVLSGNKSTQPHSNAQQKPQPMSQQTQTALSTIRGTN